MAVTKTRVLTESKVSTKPDPTTYNELVSRATLRDIRLVGSKLDFKPEATEAAGDGWEFERSDQLDSWSCDNERGTLSGIHSFTAALVVGKRKLLSLHCRYLTTYNLSDLCDEEAGRHYLARVGRLAAYPYFRATFATLTQQSGIMLPPLPTLSDGPRWVTPPKQAASDESAPALAARARAPSKRISKAPTKQPSATGDDTD
jgi:hypothetical protein